MLKLTYIFFISIFLITPLFAQDECFNTDRLPLGNPLTKYDFCDVKLDKIYDTNAAQDISEQQLIENLRQFRIVLVGETHTNENHHAVQLKVIQGLIESGQKVCLALEMFNPAQNSALDDFVTGQINEQEFWDASDYFNTWGHNYRYYKPIFDYAREKQIKMYGVNVDHNYPSKIGREGTESLTAEEREKLPEIDTTDVEHRFYFKAAMEGMDATVPRRFKNLYAAQCLWDAAMGDGAIEVAEKHPDATVVVLAGSGHVAYNLSISRIIRKRSPFTVASLVAVDIPDTVEESVMMQVKKSLDKEKAVEKPETTEKKTEDDNKMISMAHAHGMQGMMDSAPYQIVVRSLADYLWGVPEITEEKYPSFGMSIKEKEDEGFEVKMVIPETLADEHGFQRGDVILGIDGHQFDDMAHLKQYLHFKDWGDDIQFTVLREDKKVEIEFTIERK